MCNFEILLIEDNEADTLLVEAALDGLAKSHHLPCAKDVLRFLRCTPSIDLILLDLGLPDVNGIQVLRDIKADPELKNLPVMILTGSESEDDLARCYEAGAAGYVTKTFSFVDLKRQMAGIVRFWNSVATLPPK